MIYYCFLLFYDLFSDRNAHTHTHTFIPGFIKPGKDGGVLEKEMTYQELDEHTTLIASVMVDKGGLKRGDRAVLVYPPSLDFMMAFLACLKAGVIAVPVFPPNPTRRDTLQMFAKIVHGCGAQVALTNSEYNYMKKMAGIKEVFGKLKQQRSTASAAWPENLNWVLTDGNLKSSSSASFQIADPAASDIAFLQYTSGASWNGHVAS